jgi:YbbR domain-containing protein
MNTKWIQNNFWIKIGSVVLAVSLWIYVAGEETVEVELKIPLDLEVSHGMVVSEQKFDSINVYIKSRKELISKLSEKNLVSNIDLTSYKDPKGVVINIDKKNLPFGSDVDVIQIRPEKLEIKIDRLMQKVMPIRVITDGEPAAGFRTDGFIIDPISSLVKGPESYIKDLIYIDTEPIDVTGRQKSFKRYVSLVSIPMGGNKVPPQSIEVVVRIVPSENKNIVPNVKQNKKSK